MLAALCGGGKGSLRVYWLDAPGDGRIGAGYARFEIATARGVLVHREALCNGPNYGIELPPGQYVVRVLDVPGAPKVRAITLPATGAVCVLP